MGIVPVLRTGRGQGRAAHAKYVRENLDGRLASRHFRNQFGLLAEESEGEDLDAFLEFAAGWIPELRIRGSGQHIEGKNVILDLYYKETGRRAEKS